MAWAVGGPNGRRLRVVWGALGECNVTRPQTGDERVGGGSFATPVLYVVCSASVTGKCLDGLVVEYES